MVHELRPAIAWNKGTAVEWLLRKLDGLRHADDAPLLPIYIGDDVADEDAFKVLVASGGIGIKVADGPVMISQEPQPQVLP